MRHHDQPFGSRSRGLRTTSRRTGACAREAMSAKPGFSGFSATPATVRVPSGKISSERPSATRPATSRIRSTPASPAA